MPERNAAQAAESDSRSLRLAAGLSFGEVERRTGLDSSELRRVERGLCVPSEAAVSALADVYGVPTAVLRESHAVLFAGAQTGEGYVTSRPSGEGFSPRREKPDTGRAPVFDLFCGVGGFSSGFEAADRFVTVGGIDLLPDRCETFARNHPTADVRCADITTVSPADLFTGPPPEVLIGGPPCQGFSSVRPFRTLTESDPRNNLFERFALAVDAARPRWFVMENVVGLLTHRKGATLRAVEEMFGGTGYRLSWRVLNAAEYGLPQRRERFVLVGSRDGLEFLWPEPTHWDEGRRSMAGGKGAGPLLDCRLPPSVTVEEAIRDLPPVTSGKSADAYGPRKPTAYGRGLRNGCQTLTMHEATKHSPKMLEIIRHAGHSRAALPEGMVTSGFSSSYSRLEADRPSVTLTVNFVHPASNKCIHPTQNRALTPREGARIQGFPDNFEFYGTRSQVVKQIGNAVPPPLGRVIADGLVSSTPGW